MRNIWKHNVVHGLDLLGFDRRGMDVAWKQTVWQQKLPIGSMNCRNDDPSFSFLNNDDGCYPEHVGKVKRGPIRSFTTLRCTPTTTIHLRFVLRNKTIAIYFVLMA